MKIKFCGAARGVTGSCHLVSYEGKNILVDCGMRQGEDTDKGLPEGEFPFLPSDIHAVLVTHAHIDHTGLIPLLVKKGFKGKIIATEATVKLLGIMLPDSGHIQEQEAEYQNRKNERAGKPLVEPLYTVQDAQDCMKQFSPTEYGRTVEVLPGARARFTDIGHLLGSAAIELWVEEEGKTAKVVFSGDIGRDDRPIINDPKSIEETDYLVVEGTYGDRNHELGSDDEKEAQFANILSAAIRRGGNIVIPSFAVGRTQELLYYIKRMLAKGTVRGLEKVPVYIDSPLGIEATKVYASCAKGYFDEEAIQMSQGGDLFEFPTLHVAKTSDESKLINELTGTNIIISSSGMCEAGRIRHHLKHNLFRADSTVIFVGYQAVGTLGRFLLDGAKKVKLFGEEVRINATIERIDGFSGHAGRDELIAWISEFKKKPRRVFLVHGEISSLESLKNAVETLGYDTEIPELFEEFDLNTMQRKLPEAQVGSASTSTVRPKQRFEGIRLQTQRILDLVEGLGGVQGDTAIMLSIMEKDVKSLADKWAELLK